MRNQRTRYGFWQFVSDIGGFHDGLRLLVNIIFAPFVSFSFASDFVDKGIYAAKSRIKSDKNSRLLHSTISNLADGQELNTSAKLALERHVENLKTIQSSFWSNLRQSLCSSRSRKSRARAKLYEQNMRQLDIRNLISVTTSYHNFIKSYLTRPQ